LELLRRQAQDSREDECEACTVVDRHKHKQENLDVFFQSQPGEFSAGRDGLRATGGNVMGHASTYMAFVRKAGRTRTALMIDSPYHMYDQINFTIVEAGVQDVVEEYKSNTSEW
jgi:hypothetical protein